MLIDLYERPTSPEASKSRAFIDKIFSLSGPDGGVVGGEDGVSTARPLKDGGREAWDMMRRLREKAWQKAGLDPQVFWTEQAQVQAGVARFTSPSVSVASVRSSGNNSKDQSSSPTINFADSYYAMIKDSQTHTRQKPSDVERPKKDLSPSFPQRDILSQSQMPSIPAWPGTFPDSSPLSHTHTNAAFWPSPPEFQIPSNPSLNQMSPIGSGEIPGFVGQNPAGYTGTHSSIGSLPGGSANPPSSTNIKSEQAHPQISDFAMNTAQNSQATNTFDHNYNFDWDQWDAVFGQYLPVVDGYMDLDNGEHNGNQGNTGGDLPLSSLPMTDDELGLGRGQKAKGRGSGTRNWADFG